MNLNINKNKNKIVVLGTIVVLLASLAAVSKNTDDRATQEVDKNIEILIPKDALNDMMPAIMQHVKAKTDLGDENDNKKFEQIMQKFMVSYHSLMQAKMKESIKQNFTAEEIAEWVKFQTSELGTKSVKWAKSEYMSIVANTLQEPMKVMMAEIDAEIMLPKRNRQIEKSKKNKELVQAKKD